MMYSATRSLLALLALLVLGACRSTAGSSASTGYREDQATRQATRDAAQSDKKSKKPIDAHEQQRQDVIDQPR